MSFGGSAQAMITSLKNNEKMRTKRDKFKHVPGKRSGIKPKYDFPEATPEMLIEIRDKLRKENMIRMTKIIIVTIVLSLLIASVFLFK